MSTLPETTSEGGDLKEGCDTTKYLDMMKNHSLDVSKALQITGVLDAKEGAMPSDVLPSNSAQPEIQEAAGESIATTIVSSQANTVQVGFTTHTYDGHTAAKISQASTTAVSYPSNLFFLPSFFFLPPLYFLSFHYDTLIMDRESRVQARKALNKGQSRISTVLAIFRPDHDVAAIVKKFG